MSIPLPAILRLCRLYGLTEQLLAKSISFISSSEIGVKVHQNAHTVRKDISYLGEIGPSPSGYPVRNLQKLIQKQLGFNQLMNNCIVGLDGIGLSVLKNAFLFERSYPIIAGFDSNINLLERINTEIPLYPLHSISDVLRTKEITLAIFAIETGAVQETVKKVIGGGVKGILNLSSHHIEYHQEGIWIRNCNLLNELRVLSSLIRLEP